MTAARAFALQMPRMLPSESCTDAVLKSLLESSSSMSAVSNLKILVLVQVLFFHAAAFFTGHVLASQTIAKESLPLARCLSLETGMQVMLPSLKHCFWGL